MLWFMILFVDKVYFGIFDLILLIYINKKKMNDLLIIGS